MLLHVSAIIHFSSPENKWSVLPLWRVNCLSRGRMGCWSLRQQVGFENDLLVRFEHQISLRHPLKHLRLTLISFFWKIKHASGFVLTEETWVIFIEIWRPYIVVVVFMELVGVDHSPFLIRIVFFRRELHPHVMDMSANFAIAEKPSEMRVSKRIVVR